ncbi:MAG: phosphodiester glycosidase family protein [Bacteroidales bacterium]|jgi:hypothetical protein|nr:phosphodiester glycosidase family protein [Bacteroidales bacterium]
MMRLRYNLLILFIVSCVLSCGSKEDNPEPAKEGYILKVEVTNKTNGTAEVNNDDQQIVVKNIKKKEGWHNVQLKLTLNQFVYMVNPSTEEATYDLTKDARITVRYGAAGGNGITYGIVIEESDENEVDPGTKGWKKTGEFGSLPEGTNIYMSPDELFGKKVKACIAVIDMVKGRKFVIRGGDANGLKTPGEFYQEQKSPVIINGSYFYSTWNVGLLVKNGILIRANSPEVARAGIAYYPTRGIFGFTSAGTYSVDWVYTVDDKTFGYPQPSPIVIGQPSPPRPSAAHPAGGTELNLQDAIGAGPVLVKNSEIRNSWQEEIWDDEGGILPGGNHPRTAVGITETLKMICFVCEGRQATAGVAGMTTEEVARIMLDLGCTDALNLDGGGSTCMLVNGQKTIKTSNANGAERAVATILTIE